MVSWAGTLADGDIVKVSVAGVRGWAEHWWEEMWIGRTWGVESLPWGNEASMWKLSRGRWWALLESVTLKRTETQKALRKDCANPEESWWWLTTGAFCGSCDKCSDSGWMSHHMETLSPHPIPVTGYVMHSRSERQELLPLTSVPSCRAENLVWFNALLSPSRNSLKFVNTNLSLHFHFLLGPINQLGNPKHYSKMWHHSSWNKIPFTEFTRYQWRWDWEKEEELQLDMCHWHLSSLLAMWVQRSEVNPGLESYFQELVIYPLKLWEQMTLPQKWTYSTQKTTMNDRNIWTLSLVTLLMKMYGSFAQEFCSIEKTGR